MVSATGSGQRVALRLAAIRIDSRVFGFDFRPSIDMFEDEGELVLTTELPGMDPAEIDVSIEGDILTIKGEKTAETKVSETIGTSTRGVTERSCVELHYLPGPARTR